MTANDLWNKFEAALGVDDMVNLREHGAALRRLIDEKDEWPTNCGRSQVYHHLRLQADISGLGVWKPRSI